MRSLALVLAIIPGSIVAVLMYSTVTNSAAADLQEQQRAASASSAMQDEIVFSNGKELTYLASSEMVTSGGHSAPTLRPATIFIGMRVFRKPDGSCVGVDTQLIKMNSVQSGDSVIQTPVLSTKSAPIGCPDRLVVSPSRTQ